MAEERRQEDSFPQDPRPALHLLIFGGTGFVGEAIVKAALRRGHDVTIFNRNRSHPDALHGVRRIVGDRDAPDGLSPLNTGHWDVVIDASGSNPLAVKRLCACLAGRVEHYILLSSILVYTDLVTPGAHEGRATLASSRKTFDLAELDLKNGLEFGLRKALCELIVQRAFCESWSAVRTTHIFGEGVAHRSAAFWPERMRRGGVLLGPGDGRDPIQLVDVKDLSELILMVAERRLIGAYNAVGASMTLRQFVEASGRCAGGDAVVRWYGRHHELFDKYPLYAPRQMVNGLHSIDGAKARQVGWRPRPIEATIADAWQTIREKFGMSVDFSAHGLGLPYDVEARLLSEVAARHRMN